MKNLFYMMHVPWGWIKQRPHFLAEQLSNDFKVNVFVPNSYRKSNLIVNNTKLIVRIFFKFPFERYAFVRFINNKLMKFLLKNIYKIQKYQFVWITDLRLYPYFEKLITDKQKLIYDCMDDILEFEVLRNQYSELEKIEKKLFDNIDLVLFSSKELKDRKVKKYKLGKDSYTVVFNALDRSIISSKIYDKYDVLFEKNKQNNYTILTYIGTISSWFDFDIIQKSLNDFSDIVYFIVGPIETNIDLINHDRIHYFGSVEHKYIKSLIIKSDVLIMPFVLNKLITAVDPVKMYEYIAFGKQIISIKYSELDKFSPFISFYENYSNYKNVLNGLILKMEKNTLNSEFIELNTWENRKEAIVSLLENVHA